MKKIIYNKFIFGLPVIFAALIYFTGCSDKGSPSLWAGEPTSPVGNTPVISSIAPPNEALAGVTQMTITGNNFSTKLSDNLVYFNGIPAVITGATSTQIMLTAPNVVGNPVNIKISVLTAELWSNTVQYNLLPASKDFYPGAKDQINVPMFIIADKSGNIYSSNSAIGVEEITQDSVSTLYSPKGGETFWSCMRFGPGGVLYTARGLYALFQIPAGGGAKNSAWAILSDHTVKLSEIEFDPMDNLWAAGDNSAIYRFKQDKSDTSFAFNYNVTAMRVFVDGGTTYLYVAAQKDSLTTIKRLPIDANGNLGNAENYFDFSANYGAKYVVNAIDFAADGEMYLATNLAPVPIVYVKTDKSTGLLYPSVLLNSPALSLAWGPGNYLYYIRRQINDATGAFQTPQTIVKLDMEKPGAPYYGNN